MLDVQARHRFDVHEEHGQDRAQAQVGLGDQRGPVGLGQRDAHAVQLGTEVERDAWPAGVEQQQEQAFRGRRAPGRRRAEDHGQLEVTERDVLLAAEA